MLITHDMGVIAETADRVAVMYAGRIVEIGEVRDIIKDAKHPYTKGLMATLSATGQSKVQEGFAPLMSEFVHVDFDDIDAINKCFVDRPDLMQTDGLSAAACWLYSKEAVNE